MTTMTWTVIDNALRRGDASAKQEPRADFLFRLGSRIAQLLRLAEEQSEQILAIARTEAVGQASVMAALSANRDCVPWLRAC